MDISDDNYVLQIKTIQIVPFKILITALKDILVQTNIIFSKDGIKIVANDKSNTMLVHLHLKSEGFEHYYCKHDKIIIGVNMLNFFKLINMIDNNDILTLYIRNEHYAGGNVSHIGMKFENDVKRQQRIQEMKTTEVENVSEDLLKREMMKYSSVITMPSNDFQKIVRDYSNLSELLGIMYTESNNELIFSINSDYVTSRVIRSNDSDDIKKIRNVGEIHQGNFQLKYLLYIIKCSNMCNSIELSIENDKPLVVKYDVASLGEITFGIVPHINNII